MRNSNRLLLNIPMCFFFRVFQFVHMTTTIYHSIWLPLCNHVSHWKVFFIDTFLCVLTKIVLNQDEQTRLLFKHIFFWNVRVFISIASIRGNKNKQEQQEIPLNKNIDMLFLIIKLLIIIKWNKFSFKTIVIVYFIHCYKN